MKVKGVTGTMVGYTGGDKKNPTYRSMKDHTESLRVRFDPKVVSYRQILDKFFKEHNPSSPTKNRCPQYINAIWYANEAQKEAIEAKVAEVRKNGITVNTRIAKLGDFYRAEEYHQKYFAKQRY